MMFRTKRVRVAVAALTAVAASFLTVGSTAADPLDPICTMPPEHYCWLVVGVQPGTPEFAACEQWAFEIQQTEYCQGPILEPGLVALKPE
ncbi:MAG: hypothetical protein Q8S53_15940 [Brevundimonas sp.]|uniref:hypothetical protein n=1 Tax=Brevundimonas sp. TaxID=1871086 RepID=UPI0027340CFA|nr:hypothetical protein [Brevundimonas sp.]MDP3379857.1 hypothetical protein [Brevundimonas sp.]